MRGRIAFAGLVGATLVSVGGTRLSTIAIPWLVLTTTGDPVLTGIVALVEMLPYVLAKALGGPLLDRLGARAISIWFDLASILAIGLIPLLSLWGALSLEVLLPLVAVAGLLRGPSDVAKQAMMPDLAAGAGLTLERAAGIEGAAERLASAIGAAGAGALIALIGPAAALLANATTFLVSALIVVSAVPRPARVEPAAASEKPGYLAEWLAGWQVLRRDDVLVGIVIMVMLTNLLDQAFAVVMLPVWVESGGLDAFNLGMLLAVFSGASIAGAALAAVFGEKLPRLVVYTIAFVLTGLPRFAVLAFDTPLGGVFAVFALGGFASGFLNPILSAIMIERIPKPFVGRVLSLIGALCWALMPFGGLLGGGLIAGLGLPVAMLVAGLAYLVFTLLPLARRSFREFANRPAAAG